MHTLALNIHTKICLIYVVCEKLIPKRTWSTHVFAILHFRADTCRPEPPYPSFVPPPKEVRKLCSLCHSFTLQDGPLFEIQNNLHFLPQKALHPGAVRIGWRRLEPETFFHKLVITSTSEWPESTCSFMCLVSHIDSRNPKHLLTRS